MRPRHFCPGYDTRTCPPHIEVYASMRPRHFCPGYRKLGGVARLKPEASMRPRHFCPGYVLNHAWFVLLSTSFNEAEAFLPRISRYDGGNPMINIKSFNEAEAFLPRIFNASLTSCHEHPAASMRPRHFCPGYVLTGETYANQSRSFNEAEAFLPRICLCRSYCASTAAKLQ